MSAAGAKILVGLADALEVHAPDSPLIRYARMVAEAHLTDRQQAILEVLSNGEWIEGRALFEQVFPRNRLLKNLHVQISRMRAAGVPIESRYRTGGQGYRLKPVGA